MLLRRNLLPFTLFCFVLLQTPAGAQQVSATLAKAYARLKSDSQLSAATISLHVVTENGKTIFSDNAAAGLAPASTQKIITAATAYALLGKDYSYKTDFIYKSKSSNNDKKIVIAVHPSGDPTLGSWRWETTSEDSILKRMATAIKKVGLHGDYEISIDKKQWPGEAISDGWIWQDIGNYYGAAAHGFNWRENQFDIILQSNNNIGGPVTIASTKPKLYTISLTSVATSAAKGSGDNAYVYHQLDRQGKSEGHSVVRGTIPVGEKAFVIAASYPSPETEFRHLLLNYLKGASKPTLTVPNAVNDDGGAVLHTEISPPLDSIVFWFNRRSINLYGEALLKTIAFQKTGIGAAESGVDLIQNFWNEKGIPTVELNIVDGSGLSPLNRVTTKAQVKVLQWARTQNWFDGFYLSLPTFNNIKMKSGTIRGVKGFCGYVKGSSGTEYTFSFLVNNYNGSAATLVQKMYAVLDVLKTM